MAHDLRVLIIATDPLLNTITQRSASSVERFHQLACLLLAVTHHQYTYQIKIILSRWEGVRKIKKAAPHHREYSPLPRLGCFIIRLSCIKREMPTYSVPKLYTVGQK